MIVIEKKNNEYVKNGNPVFVYLLKSTETDKKKADAELEAYKVACGSNYREDNGSPLYFTARPASAGQELKQSKSGRFQVYMENLEEKTIQKEEAINAAEAAYLGRLKAVGLTPAQMRAAMLAAL